MSAEIQIRSLDHLPLEVLTDAFNRAFADYIVPMRLTPEMLRTKLHTEQVDLSLSTGIYTGNELAGFMLIAADTPWGQPLAYNAGTGVLPGYRGRKYPQIMYTELVQRCRERGLHTHLLEVIRTNERAIRAYQGIGFQITGLLHCFKGIARTTSRADLRLLSLPLLPEEDMKRFGDVLPSLPNSFPVLQRSLPYLHIIAALSYDQPVGYIVFDKNTARLKQLVVDKNHRRQGIGASLLHAMQQQLGERDIVAINIREEDSASRTFFQKMGLVDFLQQYEMEMHLHHD